MYLSSTCPNICLCVSVTLFQKMPWVPPEWWFKLLKSTYPGRRSVVLFCLCMTHIWPSDFSHLHGFPLELHSVSSTSSSPEFFFCLPCALKLAVFGTARVFLVCFKTRDLPENRFEVDPARVGKVGRVCYGYRKGPSGVSSWWGRGWEDRREGSFNIQNFHAKPRKSWGNPHEGLKGTMTGSQGCSGAGGSERLAQVLAQTWRHLGMERGEGYWDEIPTGNPFYSSSLTPTYSGYWKANAKKAWNPVCFHSVP